MFSYLHSQRVNLQLLQEKYCQNLVFFLENVKGSKAILLDESLLKPMELIAKGSIFSERDIKILILKRDLFLPKDVENIIYIIKGHIKLIDFIAHQVNNAENGQKFHILFVPRRSSMCIKELENRNVLKNFVQFEELSWNFYPLDKDIISMEEENAYYDVAVKMDETILYQAALGLVDFQKLYGRIPKIYGSGTKSQTIWEHAKQLGAKEKGYLNTERGPIDQIIFLDRSIDLLSVLATQLTYEGLIDEFFGIKQNELVFTSNSNFFPENTNLVAEKKKLYLTSGEKLYSDLRDKNFNEVGKILSKSAKDISYQMKCDNQENSIQDMKRLVDKLPALMAQKESIANHTAIAETIRNNLDNNDFSDDLVVEQEFMVCDNVDKPHWYIENLIAKKCDIRRVLRLICVQCAAASGFKKNVLNHYKNELIQVYGIKLLLTLSSLEKASALYCQNETGCGYSLLRKVLNLTVDEAVEIEPKDISYVHSFYAPLTVRIVEQILKPLGWQSLKSQKNYILRRPFDDFQAQLIGIGGRHSTNVPSDGSNLLNVPRLVMVFFVGGCTFAEIAALRFLSQQEDNNVEFIIATTKIINKFSFLNSILKNV